MVKEGIGPVLRLYALYFLSSLICNQFKAQNSCQSMYSARLITCVYQNISLNHTVVGYIRSFLLYMICNLSATWQTFTVNIFQLLVSIVYFPWFRTVLIVIGFKKKISGICIYRVPTPNSFHHPQIPKTWISKFMPIRSLLPFSMSLISQLQLLQAFSACSLSYSRH